MPRAKKDPTPEEVASAALAGKKASVYVERAGACIRVEDVDASMSGVVLWALLRTFRELGTTHPELRESPDTIPAGSPIYVPDEGEYVEEQKRRVGFG